jgi:drug/metabolite transporter (DMT)-like permease
VTAALGLSGAVAWASVDLLVVRLARGIGPLATTFWLLTVGALALVPIKVIADRGEPLFADARSVGFAAAAGVLDTIGFLALTRGLRTGSLSVVAPIAGLSGGIAAMIAVGLGERFGAATAVGLGIAVVGGVLTATDRGLRSAKGAGWALLGAGCFGGLFAFIGEADGITPYESIFVARVVGVAMLVPLIFLVRPPLPRGADRIGLVAGLLDALGFVLFAVAAHRGPVSVASVTGAQVATMAAVLGIAVLRERPAWWQAAGIAVTAGGVTLLALET